MSNSIQFSAKKVVVSGLFTAGLLISPLGLLTSVNAQSVPTSSSSASTLNQKDRLLKLKIAGDKEIDKRLTSLKAIRARLNDIRTLTSTQKTNLVSSIDTEISNLTAQQSKIDADTNLATLKIDIKDIILSYRVYALYVPQLRITIAADRVIDLNVKFNAVAVKLNTKIQAYQAKGKDVSALTIAYNDLVAKINNAGTQANNATTVVLPLTPAGYPGNKVQLEQGRNNIKSAYSDLKAARVDIRKITNELRHVKNLTSSSTSNSSSSSSSSSI